MIVLVFLTGDLNRGFVSGLPLELVVLLSFIDRSVEFSDPLVPPPDVESSAPLLIEIELFIPVDCFWVDFYPTLGGFAAEPEFACFLLRRGYSSKCSSLKLVPILIICTSFASPVLRSS